ALEVLQDPELHARVAPLGDAEVALDHADLDLGGLGDHRVDLGHTDGAVDRGGDEGDRGDDEGAAVNVVAQQVVAQAGVEAGVDEQLDQADGGDAADLGDLQPQRLPGPHQRQVRGEDLRQQGLAGDPAQRRQQDHVVTCPSAQPVEGGGGHGPLQALEQGEDQVDDDGRPHREVGEPQQQLGDP